MWRTEASSRGVSLGAGWFTRARREPLRGERLEMAEASFVGGAAAAAAGGCGAVDFITTGADVSSDFLQQKSHKNSRILSWQRKKTTANAGLFLALASRTLLLNR